MLKILDGGVGRELARRGAPFRQPEWSALALWEAPEIVSAVHQDFIAAGAEVITTNNYAVVPFHIGEQRFAEQGRDLTKLALNLAQQAVQQAAKPVMIAGCIPPLFGSYRADLYQAERVAQIANPIIESLQGQVDLWLAETQSSLLEVEQVHGLLPKDGTPYWVSFSLQDQLGQARALLRSGETLEQAAEVLKRIGADAVLFNCCQPEVILQAIKEIKARLPAIQIGAYANAFPPQDQTATANEGLDALREDLNPEAYLAFAKQWQAAGASLIGGCCGISPAHIQALSNFFKD